MSNLAALFACVASLAGQALASSQCDVGDGSCSVSPQQARPATGYSMVQKKIFSHRQKVTLSSEAKQRRHAAGCAPKPSVHPRPVVLVVDLEVSEGRVGEFLHVIGSGIDQVRCEPGNLQFDLLKDPEHPNKFVLFEAYKDDAALQSHYADGPFQEFLKFAGTGGLESFGVRSFAGSSFARVGPAGAQQNATSGCSAKSPVQPAPVALVVDLQVHSGRLAEFRDLIGQGIDQVRCEPGNLQFDLLDDPEHPDKFVLFEAYKDQAALASHYADDPFQAFLAFAHEGGIVSFQNPHFRGVNFVR